MRFLEKEEVCFCFRDFLCFFSTSFAGVFRWCWNMTARWLKPNFSTHTHAHKLGKDERESLKTGETTMEKQVWLTKVGFWFSLTRTHPGTHTPRACHALWVKSVNKELRMGGGKWKRERDTDGPRWPGSCRSSLHAAAVFCHCFLFSMLHQGSVVTEAHGPHL